MADIHLPKLCSNHLLSSSALNTQIPTLFSLAQSSLYEPELSNCLEPQGFHGAPKHNKLNPLICLMSIQLLDQPKNLKSRMVVFQGL